MTPAAVTLPDPLAFSIPMRGNEFWPKHRRQAYQIVFDPHEG